MFRLILFSLIGASLSLAGVDWRFTPTESTVVAAVRVPELLGSSAGPDLRGWVVEALRGCPLAVTGSITASLSGSLPFLGGWEVSRVCPPPHCLSMWLHPAGHLFPKWKNQSDRKPLRNLADTREGLYPFKFWADVPQWVLWRALLRALLAAWPVVLERQQELLVAGVVALRRQRS